MDFFLPCFCFKGQIAIITLQPECFGAFWGHFPDTTRKRSLKERSTTSRLHPNLGVPKLLMIMKVLTPPENSQLVHLKLNIPPKGSKQKHGPKSPKFFGASSFQPLVVRGGCILQCSNVASQSTSTSSTPNRPAKLRIKIHVNHVNLFFFPWFFVYKIVAFCSPKNNTSIASPSLNPPKNGEVETPKRRFSASHPSRPRNHQGLENSEILR